MFDLRTELPRLLPEAIAWAEFQANEALERGERLTTVEIRLARAVGVLHADRIRIMNVPRIPFPDNPQLRLAAMETGLLDDGTDGLTLGYAIYLVNGRRSNRLVSHECRHVHQYETVGSIAAFLPVYLQQIAEHGYEHAPFEIDARLHELESP